jgi:hypothetical protein
LARARNIIAERAHSTCYADLQRIRVLAKERNRPELIECVGLSVDIGQRDAAGAEHADRIAVGFGIRDLTMTDGSARARPIEYHDRHLDLLAQRIGE